MTWSPSTVDRTPPPLHCTATHSTPTRLSAEVNPIPRFGAGRDPAEEEVEVAGTTRSRHQLKAVGSASKTSPKAGLDALAARANTEHKLASEAWQSGLDHAIAAGEALRAAKAQVNRGHWLNWLARHFEASVDTAEIYMRVADPANSEHVRKLSADQRSIRAAMKVLREAKGKGVENSKRLAVPSDVRYLIAQLIAQVGTDPAWEVVRRVVRAELSRSKANDQPSFPDLSVGKEDEPATTPS
jgi:Protein of unknown function (DUF3102)